MSELQKIAPATYELPKTGDMLVPGLVIATDALLNQVDIERPLDQVRNVAQLPGIVGYSIAMPDIHWGYGFPIGGVAAMDAKRGVISPGGVGYDINCGVRLALLPIAFRNLTEEHKHQILTNLFHLIPSGVGHGRKIKGLSEADYRAMITMGSRWSVEQGFGFASDLEHCESLGLIEDGDIAAISSHAKERGSKQLGSIGSGNHFVEVGEVEGLFLEDVAAKWGIEKGQTYVIIHSGSRGFGHQVCQDYLNAFVKAGYAKGLPDSQLVCAPIQSELGVRYFQAMAAAANFAFNNRQQILHFVREAFHKVLGIAHEHVKLLYDVCHNIAKFEVHKVQGQAKKLCVHRKGATRAFGPGEPELSPLFQKTGQPVLVPGDMGRASYVLVGQGNPETWCSCCHGAGRAQSRIQSMKNWKGKDIREHMRRQGVEVMAASYRTIAEEMPDAYKDVDLVVAAVQEANLAKIVARLRPHLVVKG